jgi:gamma-glutamyltranspeptidase/glutathione hydrolase
VTVGPPGLERKPVFAANGVVATSQPLAAAATLTVAQPGSNDIGGDLFALVWRDGELVGVERVRGARRTP